MLWQRASLGPSTAVTCRFRFRQSAEIEAYGLCHTVKVFLDVHMAAMEARYHAGVARTVQDGLLCSSVVKCLFVAFDVCIEAVPPPIICRAAVLVRLQLTCCGTRQHLPLAAVD